MNYMKKTLFLISLSIFISSEIIAQSDFSVAYTLGAGLTSLQGDLITDEAESQINLVVAVHIEKSLNENFFLRSGVDFGRKSIEIEGFTVFSQSDINLDSSESLKASVDALSVPFMIGYKSTGELKVIAAAGPYVSLLLRPENVIAKTFEFGASFNLGLEYALGKGALRLEVSEVLGISDINNSQLDIAGDAITTNRLGINFGYVMPIN